MKSLMTVMMLALGTSLFAQLEAGNILFNVDYELGFGYSQSASVDGEDAPDSAFDGSDVSSGLVRIDAQYQLADAISAGLVGRFGSFTTSFDDSDLDDSKSNATEIGLEARYSFVNSESLNVFAAPSFGISNTKADEIPDGADEDDFKSSGTFWGIAAGANYFFNEMFGANLRVGYGGHNYSDDQDFGAGEVEVKSGLAGIELGVGVTVKL